MAQITAKFKDACCVCGQGIKKGDEIHFVARNLRVFHERCGLSLEDGGKHDEFYRVPTRVDDTWFVLVEPDTYRLVTKTVYTEKVHGGKLVEVPISTLSKLDDADATNRKKAKNRRFAKHYTAKSGVRQKDATVIVDEFGEEQDSVDEEDGFEFDEEEAEKMGIHEDFDKDDLFRAARRFCKKKKKRRAKK